MSKLEQLIQELCPDGVEYKKFNEVAEYIRGVSYNKSKEINNGKEGHKLLRANNITLLSNELNYDEVKIIDFSVNVKPNQMLLKNDILICAGSGSKEHIGKVAFIEKNINYTFGGFMGVIRIKHNIMNPRYMFHIMTSPIFKAHLSKVSNSSTINNINNDTWKEFYFPVPPLEVQCEIVRILDHFTLLTAELTARKNQYDYYMDACFKSIKSTVKVKMSDVLISLKTGLNPRKFFQLNTDDAQGYYVTVRELGDRQVKYWQSKDKVNQVGLNRINERSNLEINDVLFSGTGTIGRVSLIEEKPNNWNVKEGVYILKPDTKVINPVFLMYLMKSNYMRNIYSNYIVGSPVASVPMKDLKELEFDLPSIEEQEKIVAILDRFDKLCNDISEGLPAEIEARQKQYEYYREKLLSFKEVKKYE